MESADSDEHDGAGEGAKDVFGDDNKEVPCFDCSVSWEDPYCDVGETCRYQTADERPHPEGHRGEVSAPFAGVVAETDLEWEVDEDG